MAQSVVMSTQPYKAGTHFTAGGAEGLVHDEKTPGTGGACMLDLTTFSVLGQMS